MNNTITISDLKDCINEIPAALIAVNSLLSPKLPNVINAESNIAKGKAWDTSIKLIYQKNWARTSIVSPLPIRRLTYFHRNCIIRTN